MQQSVLLLLVLLSAAVGFFPLFGFGRFFNPSTFSMGKNPHDTLFVIVALTVGSQAVILFGLLPLYIWLWDVSIPREIPINVLRALVLFLTCFSLLASWKLSSDDIRQIKSHNSLIEGRAKSLAKQNALNKREAALKEAIADKQTKIERGIKEPRPLASQFLQQLALRLAGIGVAAILGLLFGGSAEIVLWSSAAAGVTASVILVLQSN